MVTCKIALFRHTAVLAALSAEAAFGGSLKLEKLGAIDVDHPAFLFYHSGSGSEGALVGTSFTMFGGTNVFKVEEIGKKLTSLDTVKAHDVSGEFIWPNSADLVPDSVFGPNKALVADGFLVPGKGNGGLYILDMQTGERHPLVAPKSGWFFHSGIWTDMNGDGNLDCVTARANKPMFGGGQGEMLWLENPGNGAMDGWDEHVMVEGPDVFVRSIHLKGVTAPSFVAAEFFGQAVSLVYQNEAGKWQRKVIDDTIGSVFDVRVADLNQDGREELVVTNHVKDSRSGVYAYEAPLEGPIKGKWMRHTLLSGMETRQGGMGQASPGSPIPFFPNLADRSGRPWILVAGDGSQRLHLLVPGQGWEYKEEILLDAQCTVGQPVIADVDGDGLQEIFAPAYDSSKIFGFSYRPAN